MEILDPNRRLPQHMIIQSVDNHLYRIGLCVKRSDFSKKRSIFCNPFLVFTLMSIEWIRTFVFIIIPQKSLKTQIRFCDFGHLSGIGILYNLIMCSGYLTPITLAAIHYQIYKSGEDLTFLRVFQMMSGLVSPISVGLTEKKHIIWLNKRTRLPFKVMQINNLTFIPVLCFSFIITPYIISGCTAIELILYGVPNALFMTISAIHIYNIQFFHLLYFYIICHYLKIRIKTINENLSKKKTLNIRYIESQLKALNSLYLEINEYNSQFWSKFLIMFWATQGSYIVFLIKLSVLPTVPLIFNLVAAFVTSQMSCLFLFVIFTASSVNYEANKSYEIFHHLMVSSFVGLNCRQKPMRKNVFSQFKVKLEIENDDDDLKIFSNS